MTISAFTSTNSISIYTVIKKMSKFSPKWILNTSKCLTVVETAIASET